MDAWLTRIVNGRTVESPVRSFCGYMRLMLLQEIFVQLLKISVLFLVVIAVACSKGDSKQLTLSRYLSAATSATVVTITPDPNGGATTKELSKLDEKATRAYLGKVDLNQTASGGLVRCPDDVVMKFLDANGKELGSFGFCGEHARFDPPDGTFGGIKAPRPN